MRVLGVDTAGPVAGVALWNDGVVTSRVERVTRGAETRLVPWAVDLCEAARLRLTDLDGVAVAHGPGAFTGLRVGLATATGLALALGVPIWGCSSLRSRAQEVGEGAVLSLLDARKSRVYAQAFLKGEATGPAGDISPQEALTMMSAPFVATGEGAIVYQDLVLAAGGLVAPGADSPGVEGLVRLAAAALGVGGGVAPSDILPVYLREPDAKPRKRT